MLWIDKPETVFVQGHMAKWLNQEACFDRWHEHGRGQDRYPMPGDCGMAVKYLRFEPNAWAILAINSATRQRPKPKVPPVVFR